MNGKKQNQVEESGNRLFGVETFTMQHPFEKIRKMCTFRRLFETKCVSVYIRTEHWSTLDKHFNRMKKYENAKGQNKAIDCISVTGNLF